MLARLTARHRSIALGGLTLVAALLIGLMSEFAGLSAALDAGLHGGWVRLGAALGLQRDTRDEVVLVVADAETFAAWGPGPWSSERLDALRSGIESGSPELIAEVGHGRMFQTEVEERPSLWVRGGLEDGALRVAPDSSFAALADRVGLGTLGETVTVDWLLPSERLGMVSALDVAEGRVDPARFSGRVVLLGVDDPSQAAQVDTALGRLSPAVVEAHALSGLIDARSERGAWLPRSPGLAYGLGLLLAAFGLSMFMSERPGVGFRVGAGLVAAPILTDALAHVVGVFEIGTTQVLVVVLAAFAGHWIVETLSARVALRQLWSGMVVDQALITAEDLEQADASFWADLTQQAGLGARVRIPGASSVVLEREGLGLRPHLEAGLDAGLLDGLSLRLWSAPHRQVWTSLRPVVSASADLHTLSLPIAHHGELMGLWIVRSPAAVSADQLADLERVAARMGRTLAQRRERRARELGGRPLSLRENLEVVEGGLRELEDRRAWSLDLVDQLPLNSVICSVWGEVEHVSSSMKVQIDEQLGAEVASGVAVVGQDLRGLLARVTGASPAKVQSLMRTVVSEGLALQLRAIGAGGREQLWTLSRLQRQIPSLLPTARVQHECSLLLSCWPAAARRPALSTGPSSTAVRRVG